MGAHIRSYEAEFRRYKALADAAMDQVPEGRLHSAAVGSDNSITVIAWHVGGNLASRFTDFLDADGEKDWRNRDSEFESREPTRAELVTHWESGWGLLLDSLSSLADDQLDKIVAIRSIELTVREALLRALAHVAYHVGQIVYMAKAIRGDQWINLSVVPGGSAAYNQNPTGERAEWHSERLNKKRES